MITYRKASIKTIQALSRKLQKLLEDKNSQLYQDNVAKFGIPEEYVKEAFSEKTMLEAAAQGKSTFYIALENGCKILGFAQTIRRDSRMVELDRIAVFPEHTRKGIGTQLLNKALADQKKNALETVVVNAGEGEDHARRFYEENGFKKTAENTVDTPWGTKLALVTYQLDL